MAVREFCIAHAGLLLASLSGVGLACLCGCGDSKPQGVQVGAAITDPTLEATEREDHAPGKDEVIVPKKPRR